MEFREQVAQVHGAKLSVNDLVLKACALALRKVPEANASFTEEAIIQHARVDIGMAVAIEDGLITPVIRDADKKTIGQIGTEARELAGRAPRAQAASPRSTRARRSPSRTWACWGSGDFAAIINPPEGAILAVGNVRKVPVVKDGKIVVGQRMSITLSCDHRVIDGALGAKLLQAIVAILEKPISLAFSRPCACARFSRTAANRSCRRSIQWLTSTISSSSAPARAATSPRSAPRSSG